MLNRKLEIVRALNPQLPDSLKHPEEQAMLTWWANIRDSGGLRLTPYGYKVMHDQLEIESWSVDIAEFKNTLTKKILLELDHKLEYPYYIDFKQKRLIFFSSREAMMATLYGDISAWLKNQQ